MKRDPISLRAVVGNLIIEPQAEEPQVVQPLGQQVHNGGVARAEIRNATNELLTESHNASLDFKEAVETGGDDSQMATLAKVNGTSHQTREGA